MGTPRQHGQSDETHSTRARHEDRRDIAPLHDAATDANEDAVDRAIEMTFPASDPPAWTATK